MSSPSESEQYKREQLMSLKPDKVDPAAQTVADNDTTVDEASEAPPVPAEVVEDSENTNESIQAAVEIESVEQKEDPSENHVDVNKYRVLRKYRPRDRRICGQNANT